MTIFKNIMISLVCLCFILIVLLNIDTISDKIINFLNPLNNNHVFKDDGYEYTNFSLVKNTSDFTPFGKQDILNIFYSVLNHGVENETFYCPKEYKNCIEDIKEISNDEVLLTHLNNFVHPYHSFSSINTDINDTGEIHLDIYYIYTSSEIEEINNEVDKIINEIVSEDDDVYDQLKAIHDYIINITKYDVDNKNEKSYSAYGTLFNHLATCNGYTDLMAIFLHKLGITNYKIATTNDASGHIWNALYINNEWLHLDLTWDDPVSSDNKDYLYHKYFLINNEELITADSNIKSKEHIFDKAIYKEFK